MAYDRIRTDESLRETVRHGNDEYPFQYYLEDIWLFDFHCIDWHWHPEVELVFIEKGKADFFIGCDRHTLSAGTGIFINSQVIHRFETCESTVIPNIVFSPLLLSPETGLIYQKYIRPVIASTTQYILFSPDDPVKKDMLNTLTEILAMQETENVSEIKTVELLLNLWRMIYENTDAAENTFTALSSVRTQAQLQIMMQYIHDNYPRQISLEDIARTVMLSKSSVLNIFNNNIHTTPISYLIDYRLKCAAKLLTATESSIFSIAQDTGFDNIGYFCRKFKERFHLTPSEFRKNGKQPLAAFESITRRI